MRMPDCRLLRNPARRLPFVKSCIAKRRYGEVVPSIQQQCRSSGTALLEVTLSSPINWSVFYRTPSRFPGCHASRHSRFLQCSPSFSASEHQSQNQQPETLIRIDTADGGASGRLSNLIGDGTIAGRDFSRKCDEAACLFISAAVCVRRCPFVILPCQWRGSPGSAFFPLCP